MIRVNNKDVRTTSMTSFQVLKNVDSFSEIKKKQYYEVQTNQILIELIDKLSQHQIYEASRQMFIMINIDGINQ